MRNSLQDYMRVGIVHFMAFPSPTDGESYLRQISQIVDDEFFSAIEVTSAPDTDTADAARALLSSSGVTIGFGAQPILLGNHGDLNSLDEDHRTRSVALVQDAVDRARQIGATKIGVLSGPDPGAGQRTQAIENLTRSMCEICSYAKQNGDLDITLELFDHDTDKRCLVGPTSLAVQIAKEVRKTDPTFGLMVDLSHLPMQGESPAKALHTTRDYLTHAHMGNCVIRDKNHPLYGDKHPNFDYPGGEVGVVELAEYLRSLLDIGYLAEGSERVLAFEIKPSSGEYPDTIIAHAKRTLRRAWQRV